MKVFTKKRITIVLLLFILNLFFLRADEEAGFNMKQKVLLLPFQQLTANAEYEWLALNIFSAFEINFKKQDSILLMTDENNIFSQSNIDSELILQKIKTEYNAQTCILGEYYVAREELHIMVRVVDMFSLRDKNCFVETMPADLDMLPNIHKMSENITLIVAKTLPALSREALVQKQIIFRLQQKLDNEEKVLNDILGKHHEIIISPFIGLHLGRTIISWARMRPMVAPPLFLEYSFFPGDFFHIRTGIEYLPFDLIVADVTRTGIGFNILFGIHTQSLFSFHIDTGIALTYDYNTYCSALTDLDENMDPIVPGEIKRLSLSIPLQFGLSLYVNRSFFSNFRICCYGLTYTFEDAEPGTYALGESALMYHNGFSLLNFLCLSITVNAGIRF